jgi:gluconokinase
VPIDDPATARPTDSDLPTVTTIIVMGVSGAGKSTAGTLLAQRLDVDFAEADTFHPATNIAKMMSGLPLDDSDRLEWIRSIADWIRDHHAKGESCVVACSALKFAYRETLRQGDENAFFAHLELDARESKQRVVRRTDHFLPASLVDSQFDVMEPLDDREHGASFDATLPRHTLVDAILRASGLKVHD